MPFLSKPSGAARMSIMYVTAGALIDVWSIIYWVYLNRHPDGHTDVTYYWVYGFFFSGLVLLVIGLALGRIGRAAQHAELPPEAPLEPTGGPGNVVAPGTMGSVVGANGGAPQYYTIPAPLASPIQQGGAPVVTTPAVPAGGIRQTR
jgi:hypothetical protein